MDGGNRSDEDALAARWDLATTVLTHLSQRSGSKLALHQRLRPRRPRRAGALGVRRRASGQRGAWDWSGVEIGVRFARAGPMRPRFVQASSAPSYAVISADDAQPALHAV